MAKPNYSFEKRQRELEKQKKQEEKRMKKAERKQGPEQDSPDPAGSVSAPDTGKAS